MYIRNSLDLRYKKKEDLYKNEKDLIPFLIKFCLTI